MFMGQLLITTNSFPTGHGRCMYSDDDAFEATVNNLENA